MVPPSHHGLHFTPTLHNKAEGPTDPKNNILPSNFVAVITGAGKGVGYDISLAYARAGAKGMVIASRTRADLDKLEAEIKEISPDVQVLSQTCDVLQDEDVRRLAESTQQEFGRVDATIANAGIISNYINKNGKTHMPTGIAEDDDFERVVQTNAMGNYRVAKHFVPLLSATKGGPQALVVTSSVACHYPNSSVTPLAYNLSKAFVTRMVESIHNDHFKDDGVQAFAIHPGGVVTAQSEKHNTTQLGNAWNDLLVDDPGLCGGFLTWLTREKRPWLSGRYISVNWDVQELEAKKDDIVERDLLTFKMAV